MESEKTPPKEEVFVLLGRIDMAFNNAKGDPDLWLLNAIAATSEFLQTISIKKPEEIEHFRKKNVLICKIITCMLQLWY